MQNKTFQAETVARRGFAVEQSGEVRAKSIGRAMNALGLVNLEGPVTPREIAWQLVGIACPSSNYQSARRWLESARDFFDKCDASGIPTVLGLFERIALEGRGEIDAVAIEGQTLFAMIATPAGITPMSMFGAKPEPASARLTFIPWPILDAAHQAILITQSILN